MTHQTILLVILTAALFFTFCQIIQNKPQYLVLLGIRGLFAHVFIQLIHGICQAANLSVLLLPNVLTLSVGALLGFPGILLLYFFRLYLL